MVSTRRFARGPMSPTPVVLVTLALLTLVYVVVGAGLNFAKGSADPVFDAAILNAPEVLHGQVWRLVTYGLLHDPANPMHLLLNGMMLYFFGRDLEMRFGRWRFVAFLAGAVVAGGVAAVVGNALHIGAPLCLGFSAACEACIVVWALLNKDAPVLFMFAIPMRGIHMLVLAIGQWVLDAVSVSSISAAAHFGGIVFGVVVWFFVARRNRVRLFADELLVKLRLKKGPRLTMVPKGPGAKNDRWVN